MTTQQPEAQERKFWKRLCALNRFSFFYMGGGVARASDKSGNWIEVHSAQEIVDDAECEVSTQHARITELESQLAQRFDAADMATAAAQGFRDGAASAALASAPAQAAEPSITLDFKMATDLLGMFCGEPGLVTLQRGDEHCHSGPGLYAWYSDMPEEGAGFLGAEPDDEATPSAPSATAQPAAQQGVAYAALPVPNYPKSGGFPGTFAEAQMHAFADATHTLRASHGLAPAGAAQADSVPAVSDLPPLPAPDLRDVGTKPQEIKEFLKGYATEYARTAIAARAPADSVQEDAARLDFLIEQRAYVVSDPDACPGYWLHWARPDGSTWVQVDEHPTPRAAIDAGRKQGSRWQSAGRALTLHI